MYKSLERTIMDMGKPKAQPIVEDIQLDETGHKDVASAKNKVKIAMAALQKMSGELNKMSDEDSLPTWWTNKVAIAVDKLDGMADYLDTQVEERQLAEVEIRKADYLAHKAGRMSIDDLAKKYNAQKGAVQGEINLMRDHERRNSPAWQRGFEEVEIDEGMMKNMAIDLKDMPADEFQRKYNMSKADAMKKFGAPEEAELDEAKEPTMSNVLKVMGPTKNAVEGVKAIQRVFKVDQKKAKDLLDQAIRQVLGEETELDEVSTDIINRYYKMSQQSRDKAVNSAIATILRKGDHSKDLNTRRKREAGMKMAKSRATARLRGEEIEEKTLTPAEKKKREEIARAIERDNPDMPMDKKMAIATATAKKVAEDVQTEPATNESLFHNYIQKLVKGEV